MRRFTRLYLDLDATNATNEKIALLEAYFRDAPDDDAAWALALLTGNRPRRAASTRALRALILEHTKLPEWLLAECHAAAGDLSETIALLLPEPATNPEAPNPETPNPYTPNPENADSAEPPPLHQLMEELVLPLIDLDDAARAERIAAAWRVLDADERFVYHKLLRGGFRVGVQRRTVARALAHVAGVDANTMTQRLAGPFDPTPERYRSILEGAADAERAMAPRPFFLAAPLDRPPETLGDPGDWIAEWKYDGIRAQLIKCADTIALWSRGEELITEQFPEVVAAARTLPGDAVIDGEVLIWSGDAPRPFATLQRRLNRKVAPTRQPGLFDTDRVMLLAFDLLETNGEDLRAQPQSLRRERLASLLAEHADESIRLSPVVEARSWENLTELRAESRERGVEGLMLKHRDGVYGTGRARSDTGWWKWKVDPYSVDAVMVSAQPGSGRRASLYTDYTFALWNRDPISGNNADTPRELITVAKAYSGLTQQEIETLDRWIRAHTTRKSGPFRQVEPEQVFELHFEGVQRSNRHKSGVAVRFPRIARWRTDKPADEADTIETLRALIREDAP